jgi:predicted nucleotide-binding protein
MATFLCGACRPGREVPVGAPATRSPNCYTSESTRTAGEVEPLASIFVVHGGDTAVESQTQLLVERTTGRTTVVLHEQVTGGGTVIEQIERHGASAGYAIILLTGDDEGGLRGGELRPRARQNVILELGYFWGLLGRGRVAVLVEGGVELPSDAGGIHYITIDSGGGWKTKLVQELHDAGFDVDWSKLRS